MQTNVFNGMGSSPSNFDVVNLVEDQDVSNQIIGGNELLNQAKKVTSSENLVPYQGNQAEEDASKKSRMLAE